MMKSKARCSNSFYLIIAEQFDLLLRDQGLDGLVSDLRHRSPPVLLVLVSGFPGAASRSQNYRLRAAGATSAFFAGEDSHCEVGGSGTDE